MSAIALKRLLREIRIVKREGLSQQGIYINVDPNNTFHIRVMIYGPEDTPYAYGYYFFDLHFSETEYPYVPPRAVYQTRYRDIRFNPNLYASGKVCVSILGTWSGPQWTPAGQSLKSVLLSLQTLLVANPLQNEPGYQKGTIDNSEKHRIYNNIVQYENFRTAILRMLEMPPTGFEIFQPVMRELFVANYSKIQHYLQPFANKSEKTYHCKVYKMSTRIRYAHTIEQLQLNHAMYTMDSHAAAAGGGGADEMVADAHPAEEGQDAHPTATLTNGLAGNSSETPATAASTMNDPSNVPDSSVPPPTKKAKLSSRPALKARQFGEGYVYTMTVDDKCEQWITYRDKRNAMRWKRWTPPLPPPSSQPAASDASTVVSSAAPLPM